MTEQPAPTADIVIIGGGPAGSAAALTCLKRSDMRVVLLEKDDYTTPRIGEQLSPGARQLLDYLGLWERFKAEQHLENWGNEAAWGQEALSTLDFMLTVHGNGWALERMRFDHMLADEAEKRGATLITQACVTQCTPLSGNKTVQVTYCDKAGKPHQITTKTVIDAGGRTARWASAQAGSPILHDRLVGVVGHVALPRGKREEQNQQPIPNMTRIEAFPGGWWYMAPIPDQSHSRQQQRLTLALMSDADIVATNQWGKPDHWWKALQDTHHLAPRLHGAQIVLAPEIYPAYSLEAQPGGHDRIIPAGDALRAHDPLSSSGIPHAMASGIQAGRTAADLIFGQGTLRPSLDQSASQSFASYLGTRRRVYAMEQRWPDAPFWRRRNTQIAIDPGWTVQSISHKAPTQEAQGRKRPANAFLSRTLCQRLIDFTEHPTPTHEVVRFLQHQAPRYPDERLILGLQEMVHHGALQWVSQTALSPSQSGKMVL